MAAALLPQQHALLDAEAVLLVDDRQRERVELHAFLEQRVGADDQRYLSAQDRGERGAARARVHRAGDEHDRNLERREPFRQRSRMLLGQQFGRRHQRHLRARTQRQCRRRRGDRGLATADIALHEPRHRLRQGEVAVDFVEYARLRRGKSERQLQEESPLQCVAAFQRACVVGLGGAAQRHQRELVREQFLEREPSLRRMGTGRERRELGPDGRLVQEFQRGTQFRQLHRSAQFARQVIDERGVGRGFERTAHQRAQPSLRDAFGCRIDRRQRLRERFIAGADAAIFGMHDFEPERTTAHFAVATQASAARQAGALRVREMEEPERERTGAVADAHHELSPPPKHDFRQHHFAFDDHARAGLQGANRHDARAVLIPIGQHEEQVALRVHAEPA